MIGTFSLKRESKWRRYILYWTIYVLLFSLIQGVPAKDFFTALDNELFSLPPKIIFVAIVVEFLIDKLFAEKRIGLFILTYIVLVLLFAFIQRIIDNQIIIKYFLTDWVKEPLLSVPPFLYNITKLQFVVAIPFSIKLFSYWTEEKNRVHAIQADKIKAETKIIERPFIFVKCERRMVKILLDEILYLEAQRNYLLICTENDILKAYLSISEMEEKLPESMFARIHRSFIISLSKMEGYTSSYVMIKKKEIPIGRYYSVAVSKIIKENFV